MSYYEVYTYGENTRFETLEEAIEFANENDLSVIQEIGGSFTEYKKCGWCEEWVDSYELRKSWACDRCREAIGSRGEEC